MKSVDSCFWCAYLAFCMTVTLQTVLAKSITFHRLALWIDGKEIEQFVGEELDIYVIQEGVVMSYLQFPMDSNLPILPPEVDLVELYWMAPDRLYLYKFTDLRSLDPHILYDPLLSIPQYGIIPRHKASFKMAIPCTGSVTGIASLYINLHIHDNRGDPIPGSPIKLHIRKRCIAFESKHECRQDCKNGGSCNDRGRCECQPGFYGTHCHLAVCFPTCINNGTCITPGKCKCQDGFYGDRCEYAICKIPCQNTGTCILPEICECPEGYYGKHCQYKTGFCEIPCKNGGTCNRDNRCQCLDGYMGHFCQNPICKKSCGVHGRCVDVDTCECYRGWRGRFCHKTVNKSKRRRKRRKERMRMLKYGRGYRLRRNLRHGKKQKKQTT